MYPALQRTVLPLAVALVFAGCAISPPFDPAALAQAKDLRTSSLALMGKATEPFANHATEVTQLRSQLDQALVASSARPRNKTVTKQWELLAAPQGHLLGGFLSRWQSSGKLGAGFVTESQNLVGEGFDKIIEVENARQR